MGHTQPQKPLYLSVCPPHESKPLTADDVNSASTHSEVVFSGRPAEADSDAPSSELGWA